MEKAKLVSLEAVHTHTHTRRLLINKKIRKMIKKIVIKPKK